MGGKNSYTSSASLHRVSLHVKPVPSQRSPDEPDKKATPRGGARSTAAGRQKKFRQRPTLPHGNRAVPSALEGLTAVFGMGTGGTPPIKPPESVTFAYAQATCRRGGTVPRSTLVLSIR